VPGSLGDDGELLEHGIEPVDLWRGGVDTQLFHARQRSLDMRLRLSGGVPDRPVVLYVGRLSPEKQLQRIVELHDALPEIRVAFVGDGPSRAELEVRLGDDRASFLGFLSGAELAQAFASADVFLMPSTAPLAALRRLGPAFEELGRVLVARRTSRPSIG